MFYIVNLQSSGCSVTKSIQRTILENGRWLFSPNQLLTLNHTTKYWFSVRTTRVEKLHANYKKLELRNKNKNVKLQVYVLVKSSGRAAIDRSLHNIASDNSLVLVYAFKYWLVWLINYFRFYSSLLNLHHFKWYLLNCL